jgi:hypothetical protein
MQGSGFIGTGDGLGKRAHGREARVRGGRDAAAAHGRVRLGVRPEVGDEHQAPPGSGTRRREA